MNYLAHTFLSFSDGQIAGNLLEDFVRNSERLDYPPEIQKGILLHRAIDSFTDLHPVIQEAKKIFQPEVRLYSGAFVDVTMDYFLANDLNIKSSEEWLEHSHHVYDVLETHALWLPESLKILLPKMKSDNWLYNYRNGRGMEFSLKHIANKAKYLDPNVPVFEIFKANKPALQACYDAFFPELYVFCKTMAASLD